MNEKSCARCGTRLAPAMLDALCPQCLLNTAASVLGVTPRAPQTIQYFGDYELIQEIARGGMGVVFAARQVSLNRVVAVKRMLETTLATPEQVRRFRAEAEAAARLRHPHIVGIYEIGEHQGQHYFAMEYIEGRSLADLVRDGPLAPRRAAALLQTIAAAVGHAHQQGVLHRDLKPSNVVVDAHDQPHITDFGLAKLLTGDADLTLSGQVLGTPGYMSPEQGEGRRATIGPATDVYALGALLYHLLTGRPPFAADTPAETLRLTRDREPAAPRSLHAGVPPDLETICLKCLAKEPRHRYATAGELSADLGRFLRGEPIHARPVTHVERAVRWCLREPILAGAIGTVALLLIAVTIIASVAALRINTARGHESQARQRAERLAREEESRRRQVEQQSLAAAVRERRRAGAVAQSAGLERAEVFFTQGTNSSGVAVLAALLRASPTNRLVTERLLSALSVPEWPLLERRGPAEAGHVTEAVFSADGNFLATGSDVGRVRVWRAATGEPQTAPLTLTGVVKRIRFGDQGRFFAAATENSVRAWNTASGVPLTPVLPCPLGKDGFAVSAQDGLFTTCASNVVSVFDTDTGAARQRLAHDGKVSLVLFGPAGKIAVFQYNKLLLWHAGSGRLALGPVRFPTTIRAAAFNADGERLILAHGSVLEVIATTNGTRVAQMTLGGESIIYLGASPLAPQVLAVSDNGPARLWSDDDGRALSGPLRHGDALWVARFSGNGRRILTWAKDRTARVWNADAAGPSAEPILCATKIANAEISPDGRRVVVVSSVDEAYSLWRLPPRAPRATVSGQAPAVEFTGTNDWPARRTRDGRRVLAALGENTAQVADAGTGQNPGAPMVHQGPIHSAAFSADEEFVVTASADYTARLWDARSGLPVGHPFRHAGAVNSAVLSEDGLRLVTASDDGTARLWDVLTGWPVSEPLRFPPGVRHAEFSADLRQVVLAGRDGITRAVAVPLALQPAPGWLPDLAEVVAQKKVGDQSTFQRVPPEQIFEVQQRIAKAGGDDYYARWARWFFAQPGPTNAFPTAP